MENKHEPPFEAIPGLVENYCIKTKILGEYGNRRYYVYDRYR
jgi:hypothetical protein